MPSQLSTKLRLAGFQLTKQLRDVPSGRAAKASQPVSGSAPKWLTHTSATAAGEVGHKERSPVGDLCGQSVGSPRLEAVVAEADLDVSAAGEPQHQEAEENGHQHASQRDRHRPQLPTRGLFPNRHLPRLPRPASLYVVSGLMLRRYRVVVAKPGLDGHDRGVKVIARALRDAGFEVIYTGLFQTPEQVAETVLQEDADAIGLSVLSGAHMTLFRRVREELASRSLDDVVLFGGGIIPDRDIAVLKEQGVAGIFTPGASMDDICVWLAETLDTRESA